jgi:hypothetical protein
MKLDFLARKFGVRPRVRPIALHHQRLGDQQIGANEGELLCKATSGGSAGEF